MTRFGLIQLDSSRASVVLITDTGLKGIYTFVIFYIEFGTALCTGFECESEKLFEKISSSVFTHAMIHALNDFDKQSWSVFYWLCKNL